MAKSTRSTGSGAVPLGRAITPADIQAKLDEIDAELNTTVDSAKSTGLVVGAGLAVLVVVLVFLAGRRKGRKTSTVVTVRRI